MKNTTDKKNGRMSGMTLIEILIVVAIIGIISAIAYPSYTSHLLRAGRSEGVAILLEVMERQENFYRNNLTYSVALSADLSFANPLESESGRYLITAAPCDTGIRRCVALTATAQNKQAGDMNLTLDSRGNKSANWP